MTECPATTKRILLVPGLLEPRLLMCPLRYRLRKHFEHVEIWRDRYIFRDVDASVARLSEWIQGDRCDTSLAIVTHSFGDWVARRAIAQTPSHRVAALVSIAPVMRSGCLVNAFRGVGGGLIPEIAIIADPARASENLDCDRAVGRLVIWANADVGVRQIDLSHLSHMDARRVAATHLSVIVQPNVHSMIEQFLLG